MSEASSGYDAIVTEFARARSDVGAARVREWAGSLPAGASVLDAGCGTGFPITNVLVEAGCSVFAVDASARMVAEFERNFPNVPIRCEPVQTSSLFGRSFAGVVAWGLIFLLEPDDQVRAIDNLVRAVGAGGQLLITAPRQVCEWRDALTGRPSRSLGRDAYRRAIESPGLALLREFDDEGGNHYYLASRRRVSTPNVQ